MTARRATPADIPAMVALLRQLFAIEDEFAFDPSVQGRGLAVLLAEPRAAAFVAEHHSQVVGMATAQLLVSTARGGLVATIEDVVVDQAARGTGAGRALIAAIEAWAREQGCKRLQLLADRENAPALDFYARLGFGRTRMVWLVRQLGEARSTERNASP
jgi:ribosomal protein S18 acetylase RimI-like enzyme